MKLRMRSPASPSRRSRRLAALLLALVVAGCSYLTHPEADLDFDGPEALAPERSLVRLPPELEQDRLAVRRHVERDRLIERTVFANRTPTPGENALAVETDWRGIGRPTWFPGTFHNPFTTAAIDRRIASDLAHSGTPTKPIDRSNRWGPYRYVAVGGPDCTCVYAWQILDAPSWLSGHPETFAVDYRFCDEQRSAEQLLQLFDQIDLRPYL